MMKKLVKLDNRGYLTEIDVNKLKKLAKELIIFIDSLNDEERNLVKSCIPYCNGAINGSMAFPVKEKPINIPKIEDCGVNFPNGFLKKYDDFFWVACGFISDWKSIKEIEGDRWVLIDFE